MKNKLFGFYASKNTLIHNLDPRIKIISVALFSLVLFFTESHYSFIAMTLFVLLLALVSKIGITRIKASIKPFMFFFAFILLMYLLFSNERFEEGLIVVWRFALLLILAAVLTFSTSPSQIVYALEKMLAPLKIIGLNPRDLSVMLSATIRFIPLLFVESEKILDAQKSRGASLKQFRHLSGFLNQLILRVFKRAVNIADAMVSRCYNETENTHFLQLKATKSDYVAFLLGFAFMAFLLTL